MIEFIEAPDNAIALTVSGTISDRDLDQILDRLESVMAHSVTVDVFVETRQISGLQLSAVPSYSAGAFPLFGKLKAFRRVAVVANQAWIRAGTRIESALLPFISYRVFEPNQRQEALDWILHGEKQTASA
ncbi:STAS/SEC14 domain-containing protein [Tsuneonella sp. HG249]